MIKRREGEHPCDGSENVIRRGRFEKGAVAAVVENDERAHQNGAGQHCERDGQPPGDRQGEMHQHPKADVRHEGIDELPHRASHGRLLVMGNDLFPVRGIGGFAAIIIQICIIHYYYNHLPRLMEGAGGYTPYTGSK